MKSVISLLLLCGLINLGFGYPAKNQKFDNYNDDYMTNNAYNTDPFAKDVARNPYDDDSWMADLYDREESVVPKDPNSVWAGQDDSDESDERDEMSGWYSDEEEDPTWVPTKEDYYDSYEEAYEDEVDYIEDELDYVEDDVQFNEDRIYELEDDLDYDEQKIAHMEKRMDKMTKSMKGLQNLVNAIETARIQGSARRQPAYPKDRDGYY